MKRREEGGKKNKIEKERKKRNGRTETYSDQNNFIFL
jgi:hypothetical protein